MIESKKPHLHPMYPPNPQENDKKQYRICQNHFKPQNTPQTEHIQKDKHIDMPPSEPEKINCDKGKKVQKSNHTN